MVPVSETFLHSLPCLLTPRIRIRLGRPLALPSLYSSLYCTGREFIASLAKVLVIRAFVAHERLPIGQLYVLRRGLLVKMWRFLGRGKVKARRACRLRPELDLPLILPCPLPT